MASGEDAGGGGRGRGQGQGISLARWREGGSIHIRGIDNPEEIENWRKLRNPDYFKAVKMGNQIFKQLSGMSFEFRGKGEDTDTTSTEQQQEEQSSNESSSKSSTDTGTDTPTDLPPNAPETTSDTDAVFGDLDSADIIADVNNLKRSVFPEAEEVEQLRANLDQVTKENEQTKGKLNLLTVEVGKASQEIKLLKTERVSNQKKIDELKIQVAGLEDIRVKFGELEVVKEKVQRMEDSIIPPTKERRGRPCRIPGRRTIQCDLCPKRFSFTQSKNLHVQIVHQGRRWYCTDCNQEYGSPAAKHVHEKHCRARLVGGAVVGKSPTPGTSREAGAEEPETTAGEVDDQRRPKRRRLRMIRMEETQTAMEEAE